MVPNGKVHVFRLTPHQDLKKSIVQFAKEQSIKAGIILTCVGSLEQHHLRFANKNEGNPIKGYFEIVSLTGTFSESYSHLHVAISDRLGKTIGGHLLDENLIYTTAEIAILELQDVSFDRSVDPTYGYPELIVNDLKTNA